MNTNVGGIDKILRIVAGIALIAMAATGIIGMWGFIGAVPLLTGLMGWCPAYTLLGIKTCPMQKT
jgi:NADH:ubiquinone oxidoreductase subunit 4 (subunit M)